MSKGTDLVKQKVDEYLKKRASEDSLFSETLKKESKNMDQCVMYIITQVQKAGKQMFDDSEIFDMAVHYYDEDDIEVGKTTSNVSVKYSGPTGTSKIAADPKPAAAKPVSTGKKVKQVITNQPSLF